MGNDVCSRTVGQNYCRRGCGSSEVSSTHNDVDDNSHVPCVDLFLVSACSLSHASKRIEMGLKFIPVVIE